ncbi:hypothetical protein DYU11_29380 [Fibrisoma montanum]|uniref:Lipocalin-like domain-containing protein n=1 Tax=Fibrisoma montanum TaxID=2305895 RepID=A0A418LXS4_9BACT|nr:hypothetical protein [Fibrisoma montanum]RIV18071.1 hypothetical protein DYU11_29380 [Fibrisoma montanum]
MKKHLFTVFALLSLSIACTTDSDKIDPAIQSNVPTDVTGKWMWGTFSLSNFWGYDGSYQGKPFEQAFVLDFKPNGEFEEYVINSASSYNCRTEAFTYFKGKVKFNEDQQSFTLTPQSGNYRGFYSCYPKNNFKRDAKAGELKTATFYYDIVTSQGQKQMVLRDSPNDAQGMTMKWSN